MADEIYNIVMRVEGEDRVRQLTAEIQREEKALLEMATRMRAAGLAQADIIKGTNAYAQSIRDLNAQLAAANQQINQNTTNVGRMNQGLIQAGYAIDDLQYGFKGIANNIQPLLMGFGLGGGLAGILSIVITGVVQLTNHWDSLMSVFGMGKVKTQAEEMDELAKAIGRTVDESQKLADYQKLEKAGQMIAGGMPKAEAAQMQAVAGGIGEAGGDEAMVRGVRGATETGVGGLHPGMPGYNEYKIAKDKAENPEKYATSSTNSMGQGRTAQEVRDRAKADMEAAMRQNLGESEKNAKDIVRQAVAGQGGGIEELIGQVKRNPSAFPPGTLDELNKVRPEYIHGKKAEAAAQAMSDDMQRTEDTSRRVSDRKNAAMAGIEDEMGKFEKGKREQSVFTRNETNADDEIKAQREKDNNERIERQAKVAQDVQRQRQAQFDRMGGTDAAQAWATGMLAGGANPRTVQRQLQRQLGGSMGLLAATRMSTEMTQGGWANMNKIREQQMTEAMGPRQIHQGFAGFKDEITKSDRGDDMQRKAAEAGVKAAVTLESINQILKTRTFPAIVR